MRLLHISDLHLGRSVYSISLIEDQRFILKEIAAIAKEKKIDALLISGDVFDTVNASGEAMNLYDEFLAEIKEADISTFVIAGNHDSAPRLGHHSFLLKHAKYYVASEYEGEIEKVVLEDEYGKVNFFLLPFITPADVRAYFPEDTIANFNDAMERVIAEEKVDPEERNVILVHQYLAGGVREKSDSIPTIAGSDAIDLSHFKDFDYVALGHIHKKQKFRGDGTAVYPGAILPYHINDQRERFVSYVELKEKGEIYQEFIPLQLKREFVKKRGTYQELKTLPNDDQNYVYLELVGKETSPSLVTDMRNKFPLLLQIQKEDDKSYGDLDEIQARIQQKSDLENIIDFFFWKQNVALSSEEESVVREIYESIKEEER